MKFKSCLKISGLTFLMFQVLIVYTNPMNAAWTFETVDFETGTGWYSSLALDQSDNPHISYYPHLSGILRYAYWNGSTWIIEAVDESDSLDGVYTSLDLDGNSRPHIAYGAKIDDTYVVKYATWDGVAWHYCVVDTLGTSGSISLKLDSCNNPHISYCFRTGQNNDELRYASWNGSEWQIEIVDNQRAGHQSLTLDGSDIPHMSYMNETNMELRCADKTTGSWNIQTVEIMTTVGLTTSIAVDAQNHSHIVYGSQNSCSKYAYFTGSNWVIEDISTQETGCWGASLQLDSLERPRLVYTNSSSRIVYLYRIDEEWISEEFASGGHSSLALDSTGRPHVSFQNLPNAYSSLIYSVRISDPPPTPTPLPVSIDILMPSTHYAHGDTFYLNAHTCSVHETPVECSLFIILSIEGQMWFYPTWTAFFPNFQVDYEHITALDETRIIIEPLEWPFVPLEMRNIEFIGACTNPENSALVSNVDIINWEFGF